MTQLFVEIVGNETVKSFLKKMIEKKTIGNSLLFSGADGIGKGLFAQSLAQELLGPAIRSDLHTYRPEGKIGLHSIEGMRQFSEEVYMAPFEGKWKIFIIHDADRMLPSGANALLKTFEEPAPDSIIILLTSNPESLLPTVLSRCRTIRFQRLTDSEVKTVLEEKFQISEEEAQVVAPLAQGSIGNALHYLQQGGNEIRKRCLDQLSQGKFSTYSALVDFTNEMSNLIETSKKQEEENFREAVPKGVADLTAAQKQSLEKEVDGAVAMRQAQHSHLLFETILSWYRDLHLLNLKGEESYLINKDYHQQMHATLEKNKEIMTLENVQEAIKHSLLSIERSTPINYSLENLLITLKLI